VDETAVPYSADREWFTLAITVTTPRRAHSSGPPEDGDGATESEQSTPSPDDEAAASSNETNEQARTDDADTSDDAPANHEPSEQDATASETEKANGSNASSVDAGQSEEMPAFVPQTFYLTFIVFPAGEYHIGSMSDEPDRVSFETRHAVRITRPFALLDRELTFGELIAFDGTYADVMQRYRSDRANAAFNPHWYDAVDFCRWLNEQAGLSEEDQPYPNPAALEEKQFPREPDPRANWAPRNWPVRLDRRGLRLPTEAEWEVACRGGTRTMYGQGADVGLLRHYARYLENSGRRVHRPKTRRPGLRGLYDMHGNLWEWVHDWYSADSMEADVDPTGPDTGSCRMDRGGCWVSLAAGCRSSSRSDDDAPSNPDKGLGLRLALVPFSKDAERQERSEK
jgi:formylglycine-generating enzyme required for sulfatase activity